MFVEGYIARDVLNVIKEAHFDVIWECETPDDLRKYGYDTAASNGIDLTKETVARIFLDMDMEDYLVPMIVKDLDRVDSIDSGVQARAEGLRRMLLPLMAVSSNEKMREYAIERLRHVDV